MKKLITILILLVVGVGCCWLLLDAAKLKLKNNADARTKMAKQTVAEAKTKLKLKNNADARTKMLKQIVAEAKAETELEDSVVGSYEAMEDGDNPILVLLENGIFEASYSNGEKIGLGTWKIAGKEVHIINDQFHEIYKIDPNGDLTVIARIIDDKREEAPKEKQVIFKKLKE